MSESTIFATVDTIREFQTHGYSVVRTATVLRIAPRFVWSIYYDESWDMSECTAWTP